MTKLLTNRGIHRTSSVANRFRVLLFPQQRIAESDYALRVSGNPSNGKAMVVVFYSALSTYCCFKIPCSQSLFKIGCRGARRRVCQLIEYMKLVQDLQSPSDISWDFESRGRYIFEMRSCIACSCQKII